MHRVAMHLPNTTHHPIATILSFMTFARSTPFGVSDLGSHAQLVRTKRGWPMVLATIGAYAQHSPILGVLWGFPRKRWW